MIPISKKTKNNEVLFCEFVATHPNLYDGIDLDDGTIGYLNNYFYEYPVNPENFERRYVRHLIRYGATYKQLKAIELNERIFDITTSETVRNIATNTLNNLKEKRGGEMTRKNTGTVQNSGNQIETKNLNTTVNNKDASKELPMTVTGSGFDGMFNWSSASAAKENKANQTDTGTDSIDNTNTQTLNTTITDEDKRTIQQLGSTDTTNKETVSIVGGQVVNLVENIWNYLITPKAIDYLVDELEDAFILVM